MDAAGGVIEAFNAPLLPLMDADTPGTQWRGNNQCQKVHLCLSEDSQQFIPFTLGLYEVYLQPRAAGRRWDVWAVFRWAEESSRARPPIWRGEEFGNR